MTAYYPTIGGVRIADSDRNDLSGSDDTMPTGEDAGQSFIIAQLIYRDKKDPIGIEYKIGWKSAAGSTYDFYFNSYSSSGWTNPGNMNDGNNTTTYATASTPSTPLDQRLDGNNSSDQGGTITKVELRVILGHTTATGTLVFTPYFGGASQGDNHNINLLAYPATGGPYESLWYDITSDTNAPGTWAWSDVIALDCNVEGNALAGGGAVRVYQIDIRVTTSPSYVDLSATGDINWTADTVLTNGDYVTSGESICSSSGESYNDTAGLEREGANNQTVDIGADEETEMQTAFYVAAAGTYDFQVYDVTQGLEVKSFTITFDEPPVTYIPQIITTIIM